jgi:hypothetical protein
MEIINNLIQKIVPNRSFADIGPCFTVVHEKLSIAAAAGASSLTAIDIMPKDHPSWDGLRDRLETECTMHSMDLLDYVGDPFDVVYCSGVAYHQPDPFAFFSKLFEITDHHLILKSLITPLQIGEFNLPNGACVFMPSLNKKDRQVFSEDWKEWLLGWEAAGLTYPIEWDMNCRNWWWLFTVESLTSFCTLAGFSVVKIHLVSEREVIIHATVNNFRHLL